MYPKKQITIFKNELDKQELDQKFDKNFPWFVTHIDSEKLTPIIIERGQQNIVSWLRDIRKNLIIYGYVYLIGKVNDDYFGGDCYDVIKELHEHIDDAYRVWITDRNFNWCLEIKGNLCRFYLSPY